MNEIVKIGNFVQFVVSRIPGAAGSNKQSFTNNLLIQVIVIMSGYNWTWPQIPSLTAMKYQRHGYVERRPFQVGERLSGRKDLEKNVKGYR